uniref:Uncharacterized protein n=1 Tax=Ascaris lumbricoides TaxID=6252 RepID=A0A9J2PZD9_ASCLU
MCVASYTHKFFEVTIITSAYTRPTVEVTTLLLSYVVNTELRWVSSRRPVVDCKGLERRRAQATKHTDLDSQQLSTVILK